MVSAAMAITAITTSSIGSRPVGGGSAVAAVGQPGQVVEQPVEIATGDRPHGPLEPGRELELIESAVGVVPGQLVGDRLSFGVGRPQGMVGAGPPSGGRMDGVPAVAHGVSSRAGGTWRDGTSPVSAVRSRATPRPPIARPLLPG